MLFSAIPTYRVPQGQQFAQVRKVFKSQCENFWGLKRYKQLLVRERAEEFPDGTQCDTVPTMPAT